MNPHLFTEAFLRRLLPANHEVTLSAIEHFQFAQYPQSALVAAVGAMAASALLYALGVGLRRLPAHVSTEAQRARIEAMRPAARRWLPWLLLLAPSPIGGVLIMAAGFFAIAPVRVAAVLVLAEAGWRLLPYMGH